MVLRANLSDHSFEGSVHEDVHGLTPDIASGIPSIRDLLNPILCSIELHAMIVVLVTFALFALVLRSW